MVGKLPNLRIPGLPKKNKKVAILPGSSAPDPRRVGGVGLRAPHRVRAFVK